MKRIIISLCIFIIAALGYSTIQHTGDLHDDSSIEIIPLPDIDSMGDVRIMTVEEERVFADELYYTYRHRFTHDQIRAVAQDNLLSNDELLQMLGFDPMLFAPLERGHLETLTNDEIDGLMASRRELERTLRERYNVHVGTIYIRDCTNPEITREAFINILSGFIPFELWLNDTRYALYQSAYFHLRTARDNLQYALAVRGAFSRHAFDSRMAWSYVDNYLPQFITEVGQVQ